MSNTTSFVRERSTAPNAPIAYRKYSVMDAGSYEGTSREFPINMAPVDVEPGDQPDPRGAVQPFVIRAHRIFTRRFPISGLNRHYTVFVSLTEVSQNSAGVLDIPGIGGATMKLYNVAPRYGGHVDVRGEIDWDSDLNIRVSFFVF